MAGASVLYLAPPIQDNGSELDGFLEADSFTLSSDTQLTGLSFWSLQYDTTDYTGSIYWELDANGSGAPGTLVDSGTATPTGTATGNTGLGGTNEYFYQWAVSTSLTAGTYWLVLHNGPTNAIPATEPGFNWEWSADVGNSQGSDLTAPGWVGNDAALAFEVDGSATPEPGSFVTMGAGLLGAWLMRRQLRARA